MDIFSLISEGFIKGVAKTTAESLIRQVKNKTEYKINLTQITKDLPSKLFNHYTEIINWAGNIPFFGLSSPKQVENSSIPLLISSSIKKFSSKNKKDKKLKEVDLFLHPHHYIILGSPGAGKTTTLKRIVLNYFLNKDNWNYSYPFLIRLRTIRENENLYTKILDVFNIPYKTEITKKKVKIENEEGIPEIKEINVIHVKINNLNAETFIIHLLSESNCLLLLDGLDELHPNIKEFVYEQIEILGLRLRNSKIILTSRTGEYQKLFSNFHLCEIQPLEKKQIEKISKKWLKNNKDFIRELNNKPYRDVANRPIFLTFLLVLFEHYLELPTQPADVYRDITELIIKEWDEQRGSIIRISKYANFNKRRKFQFICELAYVLTYKIKTNIFTSRELESAYLQINKRYGLPDEDAREIVKEIESHNGIIAESFDNKFEFSHLSIQEYLTAEHIVTLPFSKETVQYFKEYPEPLAVAISISRDPSQWFSFLILNSHIKKEVEEGTLKKLLSRILIENPSFRVTEELGYAALFVIKLFFEYRHQDKVKELTIVNSFLNYPSIIASLKLAINNYQLDKRMPISKYDDDYIILRINNFRLNDYFISYPVKIELRKEMFEEIFIEILQIFSYKEIN